MSTIHSESKKILSIILCYLAEDLVTKFCGNSSREFITTVSIFVAQEILIEQIQALQLKIFIV